MRRAIVTGGESGIGAAVARQLAADRFDVAITWYRSEENGLALVEQLTELGAKAPSAAFLDLGEPEEAAKTIESLADRLGGLDALVNNAAGELTAPVLETSLTEWRRTLEVNLTGAFACAQTAAARMIQGGRGGRIVNVTSVHEYYPSRGSTAYAVAKAGLGMLTRSMALELGEYGITVNSVAPGQIATRMSRLEGVDVHGVQRPRLPLQRPGDPREVASLIGWLVGEDASYVTGASFLVDGGASLMGPQLSTS